MNNHTTSKLLTLLITTLTLNFANTNAQAQIYSLDFTIDESESIIKIDGEFEGIPLEGDQTTAIGGDLQIRALVKNNKPLGFIIDASNLNQLDPINVEIPNPIWFLPPLAELSITNLSLGVTTAPIPFKNGLQFTTNSGTIEILSGNAEGNVLGDPIGPFDLAGIIQENILIAGAMKVVDEGARVRITFPIHQDLEIPDIPGTYQIDGIVTAYANLK